MDKKLQRKLGLLSYLVFVGGGLVGQIVVIIIGGVMAERSDVGDDFDYQHDG